MTFPNLTAIGTAFILIGTLAVALFVGCSPTKVAIPEQFSEYNSKDGTFAINYPEGWKAKGSGSRERGRAYAEFTQGSNEIRVDATFFESLASDSGLGKQMVGKMGGIESTIDMSPEETVQEKNRAWFEEHFSGYEESGGESTRVPLGPAFVSEFSGKIGSVKVKGIRAAIMARERTVSFHAYCLESQWEDFGPIYKKIFEELKVGVEEL